MLRAVLGTRGCVVLDRQESVKVVDLFERLARERINAIDPDTRRGAIDLFEFAAEVREAARQWRARSREDDRPGFGCESPKLSHDAGQSESEHPPGIRLTVVQEVAEKLDVSKQQVRFLCRDGQLSATSVGGRWLIDEESVELYVEMKRDLR